MRKLIVGIVLLAVMTGAQAGQSFGNSVTYSNLTLGAVGDALASLRWDQFCQAHADITNARTYANYAYTQAPYSSQTRAWALHAQNSAIQAQAQTHDLCYNNSSSHTSAVLRHIGDVSAYVGESMFNAFKKK